MDTRNKIVAWSEAARRIQERLAAGLSLRIVTGYFDPLLRAHARRLEEIAASDGRPVVIVTNPVDPLLSVEARAVLVAALDAVELVTVAPATGLEELLGRIPRGRVLRGEEDDSRLRAAFIRRVRENAASGPP